MNKYCLTIVTLIFITLGCNRKQIVCGFPYDTPRFEFSIIDKIIHDAPNQYIISGKILENKEPLIGVNIHISGTGFRMVSDFDGNFYLKFQLKKTQYLDNLFVNFEYTGFQSLKVELRKLINQEIIVSARGL